MFLSKPFNKISIICFLNWSSPFSKDSLSLSLMLSHRFSFKKKRKSLELRWRKCWKSCQKLTRNVNFSSWVSNRNAADQTASFVPSLQNPRWLPSIQLHSSVFLLILKDYVLCKVTRNHLMESKWSCYKSECCRSLKYCFSLWEWTHADCWNRFFELELSLSLSKLRKWNIIASFYG